ncbi:glycosyltransferase family 2 protein [Microbacterium sp. NPDC089188]|uniref:glycosyltransferase family 2 protein n=1 Tax=Microbacterium sp. NPDC089188 TaxID=3154971 RepID=UPI00342280BB
MKKTEAGGLPLTTVILVTYNSGADLEQCVRTLGPSEAFKVVVVDNRSVDDSVDIARRLQSEGLVARVIESPTNDGFARAVNRGIESSDPGGLFLLNPDARITGSDLLRLVEKAQEDPRIGILAPLVDSGPQVPTLAAGKQPRLWPLFTHFTGLARAFPRVQVLRGRHLYREHHSYTQDVEWVSGCALYLAPAARSSVGTLSDRWFMYGEDIELADRVLRHGFRVVLDADVVATHEIAASVNAAGSAVSTMWAENTFDFYVWRFSPGPVRRFLWRLIFSAGLGSRALLLAVKSARSGPSAPAMRARAARFRRFAGAVWTTKPAR